MVLKILRSGLCRPGKFYRPKFNAFRRPRSTRSDHPDEVARRKRYQRIIDYTFGPPLVHEPHTNKVPKTDATENPLDTTNATLMQSLKRKLAMHTKSSAYTGAINAPLQKNEELMHEATLDNLQTKTERLQVKESIEPNTAHSDKIKEEKMPQKSSESVKRRVSDTTNLKSSYKLKSRYYRRIEGKMFDEMAKKFLKLESVEMEKELAKEMEGLNLANIMIRGKAVNPSIDVKISPWEDLLNAQTKVRKAKAAVEIDSSQNVAGSEYDNLQFPQINVKEMGFTGSNDIIHCLDLVHLQPVLNSNIGSPIATLLCDEGHPAHFLLPGTLIEYPIEPAAVKESIQPVLPPDTIVQIRAYSFYKTEEEQLIEEEPNPLARIIEANIEPTYESRTMEEPQSFNRAYEIRELPSDTEPEISRAEKPDVLTKIQPETVSKPVEMAHSVTETQQGQPETARNFSKPAEWSQSETYVQQSQPEATINVSKPTEMAPSVPEIQQSQPEDTSNVSKPAELAQCVPERQQGHQEVARNFSTPTEMAQSGPAMHQDHQEATSNFSKPAEMAQSVTEMQQSQPEATSNVFEPTEKAQNVAETQQTQLEASNISKPSETIQKVEETLQPPRDTQAVVQSCIQAQTPSNTDQLNTAHFSDASLDYCPNPLPQETPMNTDAAKPTNQAAKESKPETQGTDSILKYMVPRVDRKPKPDMFRPVINVPEPNINLDSNLSLSELLRRVRTRNRLQYIQEIRAQINKMSMISAKRCPTSDRPQCPPPPECNKPCPPKKPKCPPEPPKCPPPDPPCPCPPPPKCPPEPPKCPPDPPCPCPPVPKCPPPDPPKCPDPCAPEPKCPEKPKCPCQAVDPNDPIAVTGQSGITNHSKIPLSTFDIWDLIETLKERLLRLKTFVLPTDQNLEMNVLQLNRIRDFEPWTPIPSWPYPVEEKKKKLQCPQEGCPGLKPAPVRPNCPELPCTEFPKRLS